MKNRAARINAWNQGILTHVIAWAVHAAFVPNHGYHRARAIFGTAWADREPTSNMGTIIRDFSPWAPFVAERFDGIVLVRSHYRGLA